MRGSKISQELKEKAIALLTTNNNVAQISRELGINENTLYTWKKQLENGDDEESQKFKEIRDKKKETFINNSWGIIEKTQRLLERRVDRALKSEDDLDKILHEINQLDSKDLNQEQRKAIYRRISNLKIEDVGKLATVLGTLYDKQALANKEPTQRVGVDETLEELLNRVDGDEM